MWHLREIAARFGDKEGGSTLDEGGGEDGRVMWHLKRVCGS